MNGLIEEVGLDHNEEKKLKLFKHALPWIIGATILIIIFMVINNYRTEKRITHNREMGDIFIKSMNIVDSDKKVADEALSYLKKEGDKGIADMAMLEKAALHLRSNNKIESLSELEKIAKEAHNNLTKSYAKIIWMSIIVDQEKISDHEQEIMQNNLKSFKNDDVEFFGTAQVLGAFFYLKDNQVDKARESLQKVIGNDNVPQLVKDQAMALLANLSN